MEHLAQRLDKIIRPAVRAHLRRRPGPLASLDEDDLVHELLLRLYENNARHLRRWSPDRGPLEPFIRLYAKHRLIELERKERRRQELLPAPQPLEDAIDPSQRDRPDELAMARQLAGLLRADLHRRLQSPAASKMIDLLYDRELSTDQAVQASGMNRSQVFRWRASIRRLARARLRALLAG